MSCNKLRRRSHRADTMLDDCALGGCSASWDGYVSPFSSESRVQTSVKRRLDIFQSCCYEVNRISCICPCPRALVQSTNCGPFPPAKSDRSLTAQDSKECQIRRMSPSKHRVSRNALPKSILSKSQGMRLRLALQQARSVASSKGRRRKQYPSGNLSRKGSSSNGTSQCRYGTRSVIHSQLTEMICFRDKQRSTASFFTDFYKPRQGKNKGFWVWWM